MTSNARRGPLPAASIRRTAASLHAGSMSWGSGCQRVTAGRSGGGLVVGLVGLVGLDGLGPVVVEVGRLVASERVAGDVRGLLEPSLHAVSTTAAPATTTPRRVTRSMPPV